MHLANGVHCACAIIGMLYSAINEKIDIERVYLVVLPRTEKGLWLYFPLQGHAVLRGTCPFLQSSGVFWSHPWFFFSPISLSFIRRCK